jgi:hypothetical protein
MTASKRRRYAEGTAVDVSKSRLEVESLLSKHGATQVVIGADSVKRSGFVHFALDGRQYRLMLPPREGKRNERQIEREQWRALVLLLKAKLEVVASEIASMEQEFLAYVVLPNGATVGSEIGPKLEQAYSTGKMPALLPAWSES